jgi:quercetin dioxygenase-like cupin family protein
MVSLVCGSRRLPGKAIVKERDMLKALVIGFSLAVVGSAGVLAQQAAPPIKRTILQKSDIPGTDKEVVLGLAEIAADVNIGRHTHPGPEQGTVTEGELILMIDGQPEKTIKTGESYQVPPGAVHDAKSGGGKPVKVIAAYVVPKGQPLAMPAK